MEDDAAGRLSGSGILSTSCRTFRSLTSDIRRESRGSSPDILYLEHTCKHGNTINTHTNIYTPVCVLHPCNMEYYITICMGVGKKKIKTHFAMRESLITIALLKTTFRSTGSRMWSGDCFCLRAIFQSPSITKRRCFTCILSPQTQSHKKQTP